LRENIENYSVEKKSGKLKVNVKQKFNEQIKKVVPDLI
jgi:hypothetical protein